MVHVGDGALSLTDFSNILFKENEVVLAKTSLEKVDESFRFLKSFSFNKLIYGINTGFGPWPSIRSARRTFCNYNIT
jgi:histidine ammonia-lyase